MPEKERAKKDGARQDKKKQRMRAAVSARRQKAAPAKPSTDEADQVKYKRGSAGDKTRRGAP